MYQFPIGAILYAFRTDRSTAIQKAAALGVDGIQMTATSGENAPENLSVQARRELLDEVKGRGMVFSALCGDFGKGFGNPERNPWLIEKSKRILDLAKDLETDIVTTHIGVIPEDKTNDTYKIMQEACFELASYADSIDAHFAVETGQETSVVLKEFLDSLHSTGVAVNMDPANLHMCVNDDPVQAVYNLRNYIVHTHAKDGIRLEISEQEQALGKLHYKEVPLGTGGVDFPAYLAALEDIGYRGFLTIEREVGEDPGKDVATAYQFLKEVIARG